MDFNYESTGEVRIRGCAVTSMTRAMWVRFKEGDFAYEKWKARHKGLIRRHVIKFVNVKMVSKTQGELHIHYTDTFNQIWMDRELVTHEEALSLAETYLLEQEALAEAWLDKGC